MLAGLRTIGVLKRQEAFKYIAMLSCAVVTLLGVSSRHAPARWLRILFAANVLAVSVLSAALPWIAYGIDAWRVCDDRFYEGGGIGRAWFRRPGWLDVCFLAAFTPVSMACAAAWYPPSFFARGAVLCAVIIWAMKLGWVCRGYLSWCGWPFGGIDGALLQQILFGCSMGLLIISLLMTNTLIVLRIEALEKTMGQRRSGPIRCIVAMYCFLILVDDWLSGRKTRDWLNILPYLPIPGMTEGHATWIDLAFPFFPLAMSVLIIRVYALPLRVLGEEVERVCGAPQAQARWAVKKLRGEMAGALLITVISVVKLCFQPWAWGQPGYRIRQDVLTVISGLSDTANLVGTVVMCGVLRQSNPPAPPSRPPCEAAASENAADSSKESAWQRQVERLAGRGFTLGALLGFVEQLFEGDVMPSFSPLWSTTNDVVRQAVIPLSRGTGADAGGYALATVWNAGRPVLPQRMVTHNWENAFLHLVASMVADGLGLTTYDCVAESLSDVHGVRRVRRQLSRCGTLTRTYWVCAFSVNQHAGICGGFGPPPPEGGPEFFEWAAKKRDSVTGREIAPCNCREPKFFSSSPVECEMNKFDDMMSYLFREVPGFSQVVAVDTSFKLFTRAWCVAELAEADAKGMPQTVKIHSDGSLEAHYGALSLLDVRECRASRAEDKEFILKKVGDVGTFNARLQWLVFGSDGLFKSLANHRDRAAILGRITRRALLRKQSDACSAAPDIV